MIESIIELKKIKKSYFSGSKEIRVLNSVDLEVRRGEKISIIGASGSGKTTLLSIIGTILKPDEGEVIIDGQNISKMNERELENIRGRKISFVFQNGYLIEELSVEENILLFASRAGVKRDEVKRIMKIFGIPERAYVWELSGGEYQRVAIARALCVFPEILLADEPTGNLDPQTAYEVITETLKIMGENTTFVLVTHNMNIAKMLDKIYKIENGTLKEIKKDEL
ncbi:MAG: ABC transporter ATP-binding protein [Candidatus Calescibacterium sp.]|nr:ABC transporter ATP-binding protein [Candidatus Calescibacterium sp.]MCX7734868.1 ABC transporter ATP-binding protein [bacterium]MDW8087896.1 ABC transporter ATP-binding protein [Candidatus Calescibacterium sp.]